MLTNILQQSNDNASSMHSDYTKNMPDKMQHNNPYRIAAIIMFLIIFASTVLPGWFVVNVDQKVYAGKGMKLEPSGQLVEVNTYSNSDHGGPSFSMLLVSDNDHFTVECSPFVKALAVFTLVFFILSLLLYVTFPRMQYETSLIHGVSIFSIILLFLQALCFNEYSVSVNCRDYIETNHDMGFVWWISLISLAIVTIHNIRLTKGYVPNQNAEAREKRENIFQMIANSCDWSNKGQ